MKAHASPNELIYKVSPFCSFYVLLSICSLSIDLVEYIFSITFYNMNTAPAVVKNIHYFADHLQSSCLVFLIIPIKPHSVTSNIYFTESCVSLACQKLQPSFSPFTHSFMCTKLKKYYSCCKSFIFPGSLYRKTSNLWDKLLLHDIMSSSCFLHNHCPLNSLQAALM